MRKPSPEMVNITKAGINEVMHYAADLVVSASEDPYIADALESDRQQKVPTLGYFEGLDEGESSVFFQGNEGNITKLSTMNASIGTGFFPLARMGILNRPASLLVGRQEDLDEKVFDKDQPLKVELPYYNSSRVLDELWWKLECPGGIDTVWDLNPNHLRKTGVMHFVPHDTPDKAFQYPVIKRSDPYGQNRDKQTVLINVPMESQDFETLPFTVSAIAQGMQDADITITRSNSQRH
jgi:hypothetical protein